MMKAITQKLLAVAALAAIAACSAPSGGTGNAVLPAAPSAMHRVAPHSRGILTTIVGVGDSLTAGYQAGGYLGETGFKDPIDKSVLVPPGQENGFWADLDEMASGLPEATAIAQMYDPSTSPLPLIKAPGLNNQLVQAIGLAPIGLSKTGDACTAYDGFNAHGYLLSGLPIVRMNATSAAIRNLGVPGITLHEANTLFEPQNDTCVPLPGIPGLLAAVVDGEASTFWPTLGTFARMGTNLSEVKAAASLHPTLATVWLGANDVLKFMGSGGKFTGGDQTAGQVSQDLNQTIQTLQYAGAKTVVANLPDVLLTPYFMRATIPATKVPCKYQTYLYCVIAASLGDAQAQSLTSQIAKAYGLNTPNGCTPGTATAPCGYVTLQGVLLGVQYLLKTGTLPDYDCTGSGFTKPCVPGSGLGTYYITPAFAGKIQRLNDSVNAGIERSATYTQSAFVDVRTIFQGITSGNKGNPYLVQALSINPGTCCTLASAAGLVSFDGLHPSNTGYALIAFYFIKAINTRYGTRIPEIDIHKVYNGTRCSNKLECFADVYAPQVRAQQLLVRGATGLQFRYSAQP